MSAAASAAVQIAGVANGPNVANASEGIKRARSAAGTWEGLTYSRAL